MTSSETAAQPGLGSRTLGRAVSEPLAPVAILAFALVVCVALQAWPLVWLCFALVAGYAVSGSP